MKKKSKALSASICLLALLALFLMLATACNEQDAPSDDTAPQTLVTYDEKVHAKKDAVYFEGTILEVHDTQILVAPLAGKNEEMPYDCVLVNRTTIDGKTYDGFSVGDTVGVLCAPRVAMSLPAQVLTVYGFFKTK